MPLVAGFDTRLTAKTGTTVSGTDVTGWMDQVTGTRNLTVPAGQTAPQVVEQLSAVDVLTFNGNVLEIADGLGQRQARGGGGFATISYVLLKSALSSAGYILDASGGLYRNSVVTAVGEIGGRNASSEFSAPAPQNEWFAATIVHARDSSDTSKVYVNGELLTTNPNNSSTGDGLILGSRSGYGEFGNFVVAEIVEYYDVTEHTQAQVEQNIAYFESEWGLTLLPPYVSGPITKDGVLQSGVVVQVTAYDDYTMATGKQDVGNYVTDVDGVISIPNADVPAGKKLLLTPHNEDTGTLSSDQAKFVSDTF